MASAVLVIVGLYVRLRLHETPCFSAAIAREERVRHPFLVVFRHHAGALVVGILIALATYVTFYLMTVFALTYGTSQLHYSRESFLTIQLIAVLFFAATIPLSSWLADRIGRRVSLIGITLLIFFFGFAFAPLFVADDAASVTLFLVLGLALMGLTYGPLGTVLSELFPTAVRYTGASLAFNLAGIFGASLAPYAATWLAGHFGVQAVGYYLSAAALLTLVGLWRLRETRDKAF